MKICMYNAISIDGFIADKNMSSDWVSETDWKIFASYIREYETILMGRKTWDDAGENFGNGLNIIFTTSEALHEMSTEKTLFTNSPIKRLIKDLERRDLKKALLIGGGNLNAQFLDLGIIDELIVDIHPIIIGNGVSLFESSPKIKHFKFMNSECLENGQIITKYKRD